jgi:hypothetical protein
MKKVRIRYDGENRKWNSRRILFNGKRIYLKENPRKGFCMECGKVGMTNIHYEKYDDTDPLKHIVELCVSCHWYKSVELKQIDPIKNVEAMAKKRVGMFSVT